MELLKILRSPADGTQARVEHQAHLRRARRVPDQWIGRSVDFAEHTCAAYDHINVKETKQKCNGTQAGDSPKGARAMYEAAVTDGPPLKLVVYSDAHTAIVKKLEDYKNNYDKYEKLANSTGVENYERPS